MSQFNEQIQQELILSTFGFQTIVTFTEIPYTCIHHVLPLSMKLLLTLSDVNGGIPGMGLFDPCIYQSWPYMLTVWIKLWYFLRCKMLFFLCVSVPRKHPTDAEYVRRGESALSFLWNNIYICIFITTKWWICCSPLFTFYWYC